MSAFDQAEKNLFLFRDAAFTFSHRLRPAVLRKNDSHSTRRLSRTTPTAANCPATKIPRCRSNCCVFARAASLRVPCLGLSTTAPERGLSIFVKKAMKSRDSGGTSAIEVNVSIAARNLQESICKPQRLRTPEVVDDPGAGTAIEKPTHDQFVAQNLIGATFFGVTCVVAVRGYMIAGWHFLDAIYMVVITVFGVGYGESASGHGPKVEDLHHGGDHRRLFFGNLRGRRFRANDCRGRDQPGAGNSTHV